MNFSENARYSERRQARDVPLPWGWWFMPWLVFHVILNDLGIMFQHFSDHGFAIDAEGVRKEHPELLDYRQRLQQSAFARK
jgi:hypothetical protein